MTDIELEHRFPSIPWRELELSALSQALSAELAKLHKKPN